MDVRSLMCILDHPRATDVIQRMICSRHGQTVGSTHHLHSPTEVCSHCSVVINGLFSHKNSDECYGWTPHTLQHIIHMAPSSFLPSDVSSTAMYNLLMLLKMNLNVLSTDILRQFLKNIEQFPFVSGDDWCRFLIQRLRRAIDSPSCNKPIVFLKHDAFSSGSPPAMSIDDLGSPPVSTSSSQPGYVVGELEGLSERVKLSSTPEVHTAVCTSSEQNKIRVTRIFQEWSFLKPADQEDFNWLCSMSNTDFLKSLAPFQGQTLPESAFSVINTNIASLPSEMSHHNAVNFIHTVVLPMVMGLQQSASRAVVSTLCSINSTYPDPMVKGFIVPLLQKRSFGMVHASLLVKILEESSTREHLDNIWKSLVDIQLDESGAPHSWNDDMALVALTLLQKKVNMNKTSLSKLVGLLQRNAETLSKSSKFAKLIMELCKSPHYQEMISGYFKELLDIGNSHRSILKSAVLREIGKLSNTS